VSEPVVLPELGESVEAGTLITWLVAVGDVVTEGQAIAEVSTDKVDTEIPSPRAGTITRLVAETGTEVAVGAVLCELQPSDGTAPVPAEAQGPAPATGSAADDAGAAVATAPPSPTRADTGTGSGTSEDAMAAALAASQALRDLGARVSPLVRRKLREHELDPTRIAGTGPGGRLTMEDVEAALERDASTPPSLVTASPSRPDEDEGGDGGDGRTEPLTRTRKVIAERMLASMQTTAQLTSAVEADVTRLMALRSRIGDAARARIGSSLSPLAFIAHATVRALADHPVLNASIDTDAGTVTYHAGINLGIAVDAPNGLIVPVIRDAHDLGVVTLQQRIADVAARARGKRITPDDLAGGTFTITNTGSRGSLFDTPILNPPEVGILATPTIEKRPVVLTGPDGSERIAVRQRTYLCLSYDHRLVDGADAARFLTDLAALLDSEAWGDEVDELLAEAGTRRS
jgi:pyruvate dehydrogenase E2 component (dihydrolipoamide acetyltransferase)